MNSHDVESLRKTAIVPSINEIEVLQNELRNFGRYDKTTQDYILDNISGYLGTIIELSKSLKDLRNLQLNYYGTLETSLSNSQKENTELLHENKELKVLQQNLTDTKVA